ncbi:hypothetical protein [Dulcicalothrix desertica]|nr:hypothetical protein [Dulcicalothrix desertica]
MYTNSSILLEYHPRLAIFVGMHVVNAQHGACSEEEYLRYKIILPKYEE